jgi:hypothetical protein
MFNLVLRTLLIGTAGALVGALRGSFGSHREQLGPSDGKESVGANGKHPER